jgi:hypothetical protein
MEGLSDPPQAPGLPIDDGKHAQSPASIPSCPTYLTEEPFSTSSFNEKVSSDDSASKSNDNGSPWPAEAPRILIAIRLEDKIKAEDLSPDYFADWLRAVPAAVKEVRIEAGFHAIRHWSWCLSPCHSGRNFHSISLAIPKNPSVLTK